MSQEIPYAASCILKRYCYVCYGRGYKQVTRNGQTRYTMHLLDSIIDKLVRQIFTRMKAVPKEEILKLQYQEKMGERKALLRTVHSEYTKSRRGIGDAQN